MISFVAKMSGELVRRDGRDGVVEVGLGVDEVVEMVTIVVVVGKIGNRKFISGLCLF